MISDKNTKPDLWNGLKPPIRGKSWRRQLLFWMIPRCDATSTEGRFYIEVASEICWSHRVNLCDVRVLSVWIEFITENQDRHAYWEQCQINYKKKYGRRCWLL